MTADTVEIELKRTLPDEGALERVVQFFRGKDAPRVVTQDNLFFDTKNLALRRQGFSLRLRRESGDGNDRCLLTAKGPKPSFADDDVALSVRREVETAITESDFADIVALLVMPDVHLRAITTSTTTVDAGNERFFDALFAAKGHDPLVCHGGFQNTRTLLPVVLHTSGGPREVILEVDRTEFGPGDVECEVEVELRDPADGPPVQMALDGSLENLGIQPGAASGKSSRFFSRLHPELLLRDPREGR